MRTTKIVGLTAALAMMAAPALAVGPPADTPPANPGTERIPEGTPSPTENPGTERRPATPGPGASLPVKAKAYGRYCKAESKKRVEGEKGTPFSKCVTAMAKLANGSATSPRAACKTESKKRVEGEKGTPFSKCVSAGAKLLRDRPADEVVEG